MRFSALCCLVLFLSATPLAAGQIPVEQLQPVALEFSGYRFGQSPSANMVCFTGFCKSQAPGGDGKIDFRFSVYETPGAVSTLSGLMVVNPRYTFWDDRLYRVTLQVDCTPQGDSECLDDIARTLDREYGLTPLAATDIQQFIEERHIITREYRADSGALVRIRMAHSKDHLAPPLIDIVDKSIADLVASTARSVYTPNSTAPPEATGHH